MRNPNRNCPPVLLFVGAEDKKAALRAIFPQNNRALGHGQGVATLNIEYVTAEWENTLLLVDAEIDCATFEKDEVIYSCHDDERCPLTWAGSEDDARDLVNNVYAQLLFPFTDVLCLFVEDFAGVSSLDEVAAQLRVWLELSRRSDLNRPRVIVVCKQTADEVDFMEKLPDLSKCFSSVRVVKLLDGISPPDAHHMPLKHALVSELDLAQRVRVADRHLFSATHLQLVFRTASIGQPPLCKQALARRHQKQLGPALVSHLNTTLRPSRKHDVRLDSILARIGPASIESHKSNMPRQQGRFMKSRTFQLIARSQAAHEERSNASNEK